MLLCESTHCENCLGFIVVEVDTALVHTASIKVRDDLMSSFESINPNLWSSLV